MPDKDEMMRQFVEMGVSDMDIHRDDLRREARHRMTWEMERGVVEKIVDEVHQRHTGRVDCKSHGDNQQSVVFPIAGSHYHVCGSCLLAMLRFFQATVEERPDPRAQRLKHEQAVREMMYQAQMEIGRLPPEPAKIPDDMRKYVETTNVAKKTKR